jgi:hypothetical protein
MRLYPDLPVRRAATLGRDLLTLLLFVLLALLALQVRDAVNRVAVVGEGVHDAGSSIQDGFDSAADAVDDTPLVGGEVADGLRGAGEGTGGNVADLGSRGESEIHRLADLLALVTFLLPAFFLFAKVVPERVDEVRRLTSAARVLRDPSDLERRRFVAMRAVFSLPYGELLRFTDDPIGDLRAERYEGLVKAAFEDVGLRPPAPR